MFKMKDLTLFERAHILAQLSKFSYQNKAKCSNGAESIRWTMTHFYDKNGAQAYRFQHLNDVVFACRGTEPSEANDILADLKAWPVKAHSAGKVHFGFQSEVDELWELVKKDIRKSQIKGHNIYFTGHSLGAAMATIMASRCFASDESPDPVELHTFGSPRVGNKKYVNTFETQHYRWVNNNDIVTRVPLFLMGYKHDGVEMYIDSKGKLHEGSMPWHKKLEEFLRSLVGKLDVIADHDISDYCELIENLKKG